MRQHFLCCISIFFLCFAGFYADIDPNNSDVELFYTRVGLKNNGYRKKTVEIIKGTPNGDDWISKGYFTNSINRTGFGYLELETKHAVDSAVQAYHAGSLEGYLTAELIHARWFNTLHVLCREEPDNCRLVYSFVRRNSKWVSRKIKKFATDPYWYQVKLFYLQVNGVLDGYNSNGKYTKLDWDDILAMNIMLELGDILMMAGGAAKSHKFDNDHCSALIKIMSNNSDIYFGHNSWYDYMEMLRILKKYNLRYAQSQSDPSLIPGHEFSMSSYPAALISIDDYYLIASSA